VLAFNKLSCLRILRGGRIYNIYISKGAARK
jgi:hypothetical protein